MDKKKYLPVLVLVAVPQNLSLILPINTFSNPQVVIFAIFQPNALESALQCFIIIIYYYCCLLHENRPYSTKTHTHKKKNKQTPKHMLNKKSYYIR